MFWSYLPDLIFEAVCIDDNALWPVRAGTLMIRLMPTVTDRVLYYTSQSSDTALVSP